jgi:hypothetical protein
MKQAAILKAFGSPLVVKTLQRGRAVKGRYDLALLVCGRSRISFHQPCLPKAEDNNAVGGWTSSTQSVSSSLSFSILIWIASVENYKIVIKSDGKRSS